MFSTKQVLATSLLRGYVWGVAIWWQQYKRHLGPAEEQRRLEKRCVTCGQKVRVSYYKNREYWPFECTACSKLGGRPYYPRVGGGQFNLGAEYRRRMGYSTASSGGPADVEDKFLGYSAEAPGDDKYEKP